MVLICFFFFVCSLILLVIGRVYILVIIVLYKVVSSVIVMEGLMVLGLFMVDNICIKLINVLIIFIVGVVLLIFMKIVLFNVWCDVVFWWFLLSIFFMIFGLWLFISNCMFFCKNLLDIFLFFSVSKLFLWVVLVSFIILRMIFFGEVILVLKDLFMILMVFKNCFREYFVIIVKKVLFIMIKMEGRLINIMILLLVIIVIIMIISVLINFIRVVKFIC